MRPLLPAAAFKRRNSLHDMHVCSLSGSLQGLNSLLLIMLQMHSSGGSVS